MVSAGSLDSCLDQPTGSAEQEFALMLLARIEQLEAERAGANRRVEVLEREVARLRPCDLQTDDIVITPARNVLFFRVRCIPCSEREPGGFRRVDAALSPYIKALASELEQLTGSCQFSTITSAFYQTREGER